MTFLYGPESVVFLSFLPMIPLFPLSIPPRKILPSSERTKIPASVATRDLRILLFFPNSMLMNSTLTDFAGISVFMEIYGFCGDFRSLYAR